MSQLPQDVAAGQAIYSKWVLGIYDPFVLGFSSRVLWRCPAPRMQAHYDANISGDHLDIGVGTGYFLDHACFPVASPRITLMDLNPNSLEVCAARIRRFDPKTVRHNVLEPFPTGLGTFDSVGLNYLLHCLPGVIGSGKECVFDHAKAVLRPGGRLFGSTILGDRPRNFLTDRWMRAYNRKGIFSVLEDRAGALESGLRSRFEDVKVEFEGVVALFSARRA
jgi:SAM-dependent methyltransferase